GLLSLGAATLALRLALTLPNGSDQIALAHSRRVIDPELDGQFTEVGDDHPRQSAGTTLRLLRGIIGTRPAATGRRIRCCAADPTSGVLTASRRLRGGRLGRPRRIRLGLRLTAQQISVAHTSPS